MTRRRQAQSRQGGSDARDVEQHREQSTLNWAWEAGQGTWRVLQPGPVDGVRRVQYNEKDVLRYLE